MILCIKEIKSNQKSPNLIEIAGNNMNIRGKCFQVIKSVTGYEVASA